MDTTVYKIKFTFIDPVLGSQSGDPEIASNFVAAKTGVERQLDESVPVDLTKTTMFYRDSDGNPCLMNYQVKGALKNAGKVLNGRNFAKVKALRSKVENDLFISTRIVRLHVPEGKGITYCERPLRAETAQGPRVALARSEELPEGTWFEVELEVLPGSDISKEVLLDLLDYLYYEGIGQWRSSGMKGRLIYQLA